GFLIRRRRTAPANYRGEARRAKPGLPRRSSESVAGLSNTKCNQARWKHRAFLLVHAETRRRGGLVIANPTSVMGGVNPPIHQTRFARRRPCSRTLARWMGGSS